MAYLKHILMTGLLLSGLTEPVLFNGLFNCYLMDPGPAYGHLLNPGLSNTFMTDTPLLYCSILNIRSMNGKETVRSASSLT